MANHSKSLLESKGRSWWMRYVSNTSTGESRPEVTSGTASAFTASSDCWSSARSSSSSRPIASSNAQTVKLDAMARTWPGHGLGPFSTDQLHLDILTSCDWAAQVMSSKQEGCQISLDERKRQKSQEMKYNFVAVRGTETKPCPGPILLKLGANQTTLYFKPCHRNKRKLWENIEHDQMCLI